MNCVGDVIHDRNHLRIQIKGKTGILKEIK